MEERLPLYQVITSINPFVKKEFINFNSARSVESICILKKIFLKTHLTWSGKEYDIYNYTILDGRFSKEEKTSIAIKEWKIADIYSGYFGSKSKINKSYNSEIWLAWNDYIFVDPVGEIKIFSYSHPEKALQILKIISRYRSWESISKCKRPIDFSPS